MRFLYFFQKYTWRVLVVIAFIICNKKDRVKLANLLTDVSISDKKIYFYQLLTWCFWSFYRTSCHSYMNMWWRIHFSYFCVFDHLLRTPCAWIFSKAAKNWECGYESKYSTCMCSAANVNNLKIIGIMTYCYTACFCSSKTNLLQIGGNFLIFVSS